MQFQFISPRCSTKFLMKLQSVNFSCSSCLTSRTVCKRGTECPREKVPLPNASPFLRNSLERYNDREAPPTAKSKISFWFVRFLSLYRNVGVAQFKDILLHNWVQLPPWCFCPGPCLFLLLSAGCNLVCLSPSPQCYFLFNCPDKQEPLRW